MKTYETHEWNTTMKHNNEKQQRNTAMKLSNRKTMKNQWNTRM